MSELAVIIIPAILLVALISCVVCTSRVLNSAAHSKRLSEIAAERFVRALKEAHGRPYLAPNSTGPPIIPHLALQPDESFLLALPDPTSPASPSSPQRSDARASLVSHAWKQRCSSQVQEPLKEKAAATSVAVGADAPEDEAQNPESVGAGLLSGSSSSGLEYQQSAAEAATSFKTAQESLSLASFGGVPQVFAAGGEAVPQPQSPSTSFTNPGLPQDVQATFPFGTSSAEGIGSLAFSTANSDLSGSSEMFSGNSRRDRRRPQSSQGASSPHSSASARSSSAQGLGQRSAEATPTHRVPSADSSPLQHARALVQSNSTPPAHHAQLMDSSSSQGSLAQPGTASSSFARTASGRSSSRRSMSGLHGQQFSLESVQSNTGAWAASQRPASSTSEMGFITQGIGSREASPPVTGLPPAVAAAQARATQAAEMSADMSQMSDIGDGPASFRRFSTGSIVGQSTSSIQANPDEQSEIMPADDQQERRATMSSGTSLADQIEHALHVASGSKSPSSDASGSAARPPLAPRKKRPSSSASKDSARRARLLEAMALIGRPLVAGIDDTQDVAAASSTGLALVAASSDAQSEVPSTSSDHHEPLHTHGACDLGVIIENSQGGTSSYTTRAQSEGTHSSQESKRLSSQSSSHQMRRRPLSGEPSVSFSGENLATQASSSPLRLTHDAYGLGHNAVHAQTQTVSSDAFSALGALHSEAESGSGFSVGAHREQPAVPLSPLATSEMSQGSKVAAATASAVAAAAAAHEAVMALQSRSMPLGQSQPHDWHPHSTLVQQSQPQQQSQSMPLAQLQQRNQHEWEASTSEQVAQDQLSQHEWSVRHASSFQEAPAQEVEQSIHYAPLIASETSDSDASPIVPMIADRFVAGAHFCSIPCTSVEQPEQVAPGGRFSPGRRRHHPAESGSRAASPVGTIPSTSEPRPARMPSPPARMRSPPARMPSTTDLPFSSQASPSMQAAEGAAMAPPLPTMQPLQAAEELHDDSSPIIAAEWPPSGETSKAVSPPSVTSAASLKPFRDQVPPKTDAAQTQVVLDDTSCPTEAEYSVEPPRSNDGIPAITPMCERMRVSNTPSFASTSSSQPPAPASLASVSASLVSAPGGASCSSYYNHVAGSISKGEEKAIATRSTGSVRSMPARAVTASPTSEKKQLNRPITARAFYRAGRPSRTVRVHLCNISAALQTPSTSVQRANKQGRTISASPSQVSLSARDSDVLRAIARAEDAPCPSLSSATGTHRGAMSVLSSSSADLDSHDDGLGQFSHQDTASIRTPRLAVASWRSAASDAVPSDIDSARVGGAAPHNDMSYVESDDVPELETEMAPGSSEVLRVRRHVFAAGHSAALDNDEQGTPISLENEPADEFQQEMRRPMGVAAVHPGHLGQQELEGKGSSYVMNPPQSLDPGPNALATEPDQEDSSLHHDTALSSQNALESYPFTMPPSLCTAPVQTAGLGSIEDSAAILERLQQHAEHETSRISDSDEARAQGTSEEAAHPTYLPPDMVASSELATDHDLTHMTDMSGQLRSSHAIAPGVNGLQQDDHNITSDMEFSTSPPGAGSVFLPPIHAPVSECPRGSTQEAALPSSEQEKLGLFIHHGCAELESLPDEESVTQLPVSRTASVLTVRTPAGTAVVPGSANNTTDKAGVADLESSQTLLVSDQEGVQGVGTEQGAVAEPHDAFRALGATGQQMQHAVETSVEPVWYSKIEQTADFVQKELESADAHAESGLEQAGAEREGDQEDACSEASTVEAAWSTGSSCGEEVVEVVHEGWGSAELPEYQLSGDRMADDLAGMAGYAQMSMDSQLNMRRREFAPLDSWVPVAMETIVEEDSCDAEGDSARTSNHTPLSGASLPSDQLPRLHNVGSSNLHLVQSGNECQELSPHPPDDDEPRWVLEERRSSQPLANMPSFEAPHLSQMMPSTPGPCPSAQAAEVSSEAPDISSQSNCVGHMGKHVAYPEPQVPVTSPSVPQMPVAASPGTESTLSQPSGRVEGTAPERSRTGAALAVPSLVMDHMREGASSVGGSTSGSVSGSNPGSARRIVPAAVASWLDSPEHVGLKNRRESDSGTSLGSRQHAASESSSQPRAISDTGSTAHSGMFRPRGAGSASTRTSTTWSGCDLDGEQDVEDVLGACVQHNHDMYIMQQQGSSSQSSGINQCSIATSQPGPIGEGTEGSENSLELPVIDLKPYPAVEASAHSDAASSHRLQGQAASPGASRSRLFREGNASNHNFMPSFGEPAAAPVRPKQIASASSRQAAPALASLPEDPIEPNLKMFELKRLVQAAAARARESTHLVPPLQQQLAHSSWDQASRYVPESPPDSLADSSEANTDAWPPHPDSIASDKPTSTQEITLALPYPPSSAATGSAALSPCDSAAISVGGITIAPSAGIAERPSFNGDVTQNFDSCESIPVQPGFNPRAYSMHRRRPASIAWSACSDLLDECRSLSRADSSVRSASRSGRVSLRSHPVTHNSAASAQDAQQRALALSKALSQLTMSPLIVVYTCEQSIHGPPSTMTNISEGATEPGPLSTASRQRVQSSTEEWGPQTMLSPAQRNNEVPQSLRSDDSDVGRRPLDVQRAIQEAPVMLPGGTLGHSHRTSSSMRNRAAADLRRFSGSMLRSTSGLKVSKKRPAVATGATARSITGHRSGEIERWMAAAREAVHLMTLTREARWARMNDPFENLPEDVAWVVVGVEPGQSSWVDSQVPLCATQQKKQGAPGAWRHALQSDVQRLVPDGSTSSNDEVTFPSTSAQQARAGARRSARSWQASGKVVAGVDEETGGTSGSLEDLHIVVLS